MLFTFRIVKSGNLSIFILSSHLSYAGCLTRIVNANKYRSGHDYRCFAKLSNEPDRSGIDSTLLETWYEVIICASERYSYVFYYLNAQLYAVIFLAQSCLVKPQQRVATTSFIYFFIMAKIHDMGRTLKVV